MSGKKIKTTDEKVRKKAFEEVAKFIETDPKAFEAMKIISPQALATLIRKLGT